jgi:hypothetical protein
MTTKTFTHAGYSKLNGEYKARFANDALRVKVLEKGGHEDVQIEAFIKPLTKIEAVKKLLEIGFANANPAAKAALEAELDKRTETPKAVKAPGVTKTAKAPAKKVTMEGIKIKAAAKTKANADLEDAPF